MLDVTRGTISAPNPIRMRRRAAAMPKRTPGSRLVSRRAGGLDFRLCQSASGRDGLVFVGGMLAGAIEDLSVLDDCEPDATGLLPNQQP